MEKGEIALFNQFHLYPQCFPISIFFSVLKGVYLEERVTKQLQIQNVQHHCCMNFTALEKTEIYYEQVFEGKYIFVPSLELTEDIHVNLCKLKAYASMTQLRWLNGRISI